MMAEFGREARFRGGADEAESGRIDGGRNVEGGIEILVIDSGIGGLSVVDAVRAHLPHVRIVYLADNAGFPFGNMGREALKSRLQRLVLSLKERYRCDALVVACNTASTVALDALRGALDIPVIGTVPAIKTAGEVSRTRAIGLLATPATAHGPYIDDLIARFASNCKVVRIGARDLAAKAEAFARGEPPDPFYLSQLMAPFFGPDAPPVDTVVLGCTHYPLLIDHLRAAAPPFVQWLDPAHAIARRLKHVLETAEPKDQARRAALRDDLALFTDPATDLDALRPFLAKYGFSDLRLSATLTSPSRERG